MNSTDKKAPIFKPSYQLMTSGCRIPYIDPEDPDIKSRFVRNNISYTCNPFYSPKLIESNDSTIFIIPENKQYYIKNDQKYHCSWTKLFKEEGTNDHASIK